MARAISLRWARLAVFGLLLALLLPAGHARAAGVVGSGLATSCSEAALDAALAGGGLVVFNCGGPATIVVSAEKLIAADTQLDGAGLITLSAAGASPATRIFNVQAGAALTLQHLALTGGNAGAGGGGAILNVGSASLSDVTISASQAQQGGAIASSGLLRLNQVTLSGNTAQLGGALYTSTSAASPPGVSAQLVNVTLSGNTGTNGGGALYNDLAAVALQNVTLAGNSADGGGNAIFNAPPTPGAAGTVTVQGTILGPGALGAVCAGAIASAGSNIASDASCALGAATDRNATNPVLGPLQANGGPTQTRLPLAGSPALDAAADADCPAQDQRGLPRPFGAGCDIGAVEVQQVYGSLAGPWFVAPAGSDTNPCNVVIAPCKTIGAAVAKAAPGDAVNVAVGTYTSASGDEVVRVDKSLTIAGGWDAGFTSQAGMTTIAGQRTTLVPPLGRRGITITGGAKVTLSRLIIRDGAPPSGAGGSSFGGGLWVDGELHATMLEITNNAADVGGGIYLKAPGAAYLLASAVHSNFYTVSGGGVYANGAHLILASSTVSSQFRLPSSAGPHFEGTEIDVNTGTLALVGSTVVSLIDDPLPFLSGGTAFAIRNNASTTLIWMSVLSGNQPCQMTNGVSSSGGNVESKNTCGLAEPTDRANTDPRLGPLQNNGGPTTTHALPLDSPARDAAGTCGTWADQRGVPRPKGSLCDSGAYEYQGVISTVLALPFTSTTPLGLGSALGLMTVRLGAGSVATPASVEYIPRDAPPLPLASGRASLASFDLRLYGGAVLAKATPAQLGAPITITVSYRELPAGVTPGTLGLCVYDAAGGGWRNLPSSVDTTAKTVSAQTTQLGTFALGGGPWLVQLPITQR